MYYCPFAHSINCQNKKGVHMRINSMVRAAFLTVALSSLAVPAYAVTLLSNIGNATVGDYGGLPDTADSFSTGTESLTVTSINVDWERANGGTTSVGIYTDNAGEPSTASVGTLFTVPCCTTIGIMTYTGNAVLAPNTIYWVVMIIEDSSEPAFGTDDAFVADPSTGGAVIIADTSSFGDHLTGSWTNDGVDLLFEIIGTGGSGPVSATPVPTMSAYGLVVITLGLLLIARRRLRASTKQK